MGSQQQKLLWPIKGLPRDHHWFLRRVWGYPVTTQGKCRSLSSGSCRLTLHSRGDGLPSQHLLEGHAGPLAKAIIPIEGQASRDLSHLTLNVFISTRFSKENERLSRANGGMIEHTPVYEIVGLFLSYRWVCSLSVSAIPKASLKTEHIFIVAKVIYQGTSFHLKLEGSHFFLFWSAPGGRFWHISNCKCSCSYDQTSSWTEN